MPHDAVDLAPTPDSAPAHSGVPAVDAVLVDLAGVGELPLAEQALVLERSHGTLRAVLDAAEQEAS